MDLSSSTVRAEVVEVLVHCPLLGRSTETAFND